MTEIKRIDLVVFAIFAMSSIAHVAFAQEGAMSGGMAKPMVEVPMPKKIEDPRQVVQLTEAERAIVVADMRQMLSSIQAITDGLAHGDMQAVAKAASKNGASMMRELPSQIRMKFPESFGQMGLASHKAFDQIAQDAKSSKNSTLILKQLSAGIKNCVACHATYRF